MPHDRQAVDALLATACSRLLNAASKLNLMRELHRSGCERAYWLTAVDLGEDLQIGGHAITEAHRLLLAEMPIFIAEKGGLPN